MSNPQMMQAAMQNNPQLQQIRARWFLLDKTSADVEQPDDSTNDAANDPWKDLR